MMETQLCVCDELVFVAGDSALGAWMVWLGRRLGLSSGDNLRSLSLAQPFNILLVHTGGAWRVS